MCYRSLAFCIPQVHPGIGFNQNAVGHRMEIPVLLYNMQEALVFRFGFELELYSKCRRCSRCVGRISGGRCVAWNSLYLKAEQSLEENVFRLILDKIYYADKSWKEISF